jgi:inorganic pyrophosphatase
MANLEESPNHWNGKRRECKAVVEAPKGRRTKFKYSPEYEGFELSSVLPEGLAYPYDFGFIPSTLADDGDPVDVMILMDEPAHVGCIVNTRIIGIIEAEQTEDGKRKANHRLIGVAVGSYAHRELHSIEEIPKSLLEQVEAFFVADNKGRGKDLKITGRYGPGRAATHLDAGIAAFAGREKAA